MAGVEDERHVFARHLALNSCSSASIFSWVASVRQQHLELQRLELGGNVGRVVDRVGQGRNVLVGRIADHQRQPFTSVGGVGGLERRSQRLRRE